MASRDVRGRFRPSVVRVRISETAIRTVARATAKQPQLHYQFAHHWRNGFFLYFSQLVVFVGVTTEHLKLIQATEKFGCCY